MQLSPAEARLLDDLIGRLDGGLTPEDHDKAAILLAKRDGLLSNDTKTGKLCIRCALGYPGTCETWVWPRKAHLDHKVTRADGGLTVPGNMQATCEPCNLAKGG